MASVNSSCASSYWGLLRPQAVVVSNCRISVVSLQGRNANEGRASLLFVSALRLLLPSRLQRNPLDRGERRRDLDAKLDELLLELRDLRLRLRLLRLRFREGLDGFLLVTFEVLVLDLLCLQARLQLFDANLRICLHFCRRLRLLLR